MLVLTLLSQLCFNICPPVLYLVPICLSRAVMLPNIHYNDIIYMPLYLKLTGTWIGRKSQSLFFGLLLLYLKYLIIFLIIFKIINCNCGPIQDVDTEDVRCQIARAKGHVIDLTLLRSGDNKVIIICLVH